MATELLAVGSSAAVSSDLVVTAGVPVSVFLKTSSDGPVPSSARIGIEQKDAGGKYHEVASLSVAMRSGVLDVGTFRFVRGNLPEAVGVDYE